LDYGGTITNSYWDKETSGQTTSDGGEGKTTAEMKQQATFVGWDFTTVWDIEENVTYPYLQALGQPVLPPTVVNKEIWNLSDLNKIGRDWEYPIDGRYTLMADIDASDTINWDGGKGFKPITLVGRFDGNGHVIQNLYINRLEEAYIGLFGIVYGEVLNIGVENVQVVGKWNVGGLVGKNRGTVEQSYLTGLVVGNYSAGGLVGWNDGTVTQSYSTGSVVGEEYLSGLVGYNTGTVTQSYSMGLVVGNYSAGGLVGYNDSNGTVTQSYSAGSVSGKQNVGGLVGVNDGGTVTDSYWDINTSGQSTSVGGEGKTTAEMKQQATFVGWDFTTVWDIEENVTYPYLQALGHPVLPPAVVEKEIWSLSDLNKIGRDWEYPMDGRYTLMADIDASDTINWDGDKGFKPIILVGRFDGNGNVIRNIYINRPDEDYVGLFGIVYGEVLNIGVENVQVVGNWNVGGLVGANDGTVTQSYSTGFVVGRENVGSLVGLNDGTITQSYSTSSVSGSWSVGGLVGGNGGTVTLSYATGSVVGTDDYAGGLVGYSYYGTVTQCYSTGSVSGSSDVGGLIGGNDGGSITQSYWDMQTSGQNSSAGGTGKTTVEMKQQATFVGWDFINIWGIINTNTYPYLLWQYNKVPNLVGLSQMEAEALIITQGFVVGTITEECSDTVPSGDVISQEPVGGEQVPPSTAVNLVVSTGPCPVTVPNVVGMAQSSAENAIVGAGLTVGLITQECSDTVPSGGVISQDPLSGQQVVPSTAVNLVVSTGPCPSLITVPDVVGMAQSSAENEIIGAGLTVGLIAQECSDTVPSGDVISQDPLSGIQVVLGTTVELVVSTGPCPVTVPNVVGMAQSSAENEIIGAGLTVGLITQGCSDTVPLGDVISQDPLSGQQVPPGTAVNLVVSTGPCPEGEGSLEGTPEGSVEGEGSTEGIPEGTPEGVVEGIPEGSAEGEGSTEGTPEGVVEGTPEGEGVIEGEGSVEGTTEGTSEGEGSSEGSPEGSAEGETHPHSADPNGDWQVNLSELLRVIQFFNF